MQQNAPPHDDHAERALIGCMLQSGDTGDVNVSANDLFRGPHRIVYAACRALHQKGEPVDLVTVADLLDRAGKLDEVGGRVALIEFCEQTPTIAHGPHYARIVLAHSLRRTLIRMTVDLQAAAYDGGDIDTLCADATSVLDSVRVRHERTRHER